MPVPGRVLVQEMVRNPQGVEPDVLGDAGELGEVGPAGRDAGQLAFLDGEDHPDLERSTAGGWWR